MLPDGRLPETQLRFLTPRATVLADSAHELANRAHSHDAPSAARLLAEYHDASGRPRRQIPELLEEAFAETGPMPILVRAIAAYMRLVNEPDAEWVAQAALALAPCAFRQLRHPVLTPDLYLNAGQTPLGAANCEALTLPDWELLVGWHLDGIARVAEHTIESIRLARRLVREHHEIIDNAHPRKRHLHSFLDDLTRLPCCTAAEAATRLRVSQPTAREIVVSLENLNILKRVRRPHEEGDWNAVYEYARLLDIADRSLA